MVTSYHSLSFATSAMAYINAPSSALWGSAPRSVLCTLLFLKQRFQPVLPVTLWFIFCIPFHNRLKSILTILFPKCIISCRFRSRSFHIGGAERIACTIHIINTLLMKIPFPSPELSHNAVSIQNFFIPELYHLCLSM